MDINLNINESITLTAVGIRGSLVLSRTAAGYINVDGYDAGILRTYAKYGLDPDAPIKDADLARYQGFDKPQAVVFPVKPVLSKSMTQAQRDELFAQFRSAPQGKMELVARPDFQAIADELFDYLHVLRMHVVEDTQIDPEFLKQISDTLERHEADVKDK